MEEGWSSKVSFLGSPILSPHFKGGGTALVAGRECEDDCSHPELLQMAAVPPSHFPGCEIPLGVLEKEGENLNFLPSSPPSAPPLHQRGQALPWGDEPAGLNPSALEWRDWHPAR